MLAMVPTAPLILVVDDHEDTRDLYVAAFAAAGLEIQVAASVAEARVIISESRLDVLIADYSLPDGTGAALLELCATARPRLCVLVTGFREQDVAVTGFDLVLTKPIEFAMLVQAVLRRL